MAKLFEKLYQLPMATAMHEQLKAAAKVRTIQTNALARQFIQEGLHRMSDEIPKPEKIELIDYSFHGVRLADLDHSKITLACRVDVDWMMDLELCIINPQGVCMQLEQNWKGKHDWTANPYEEFYLLGGRYLKEESPTMLADRERGLVDWDRRRKYNSGLADPHAADVARQDAYNAQRRSTTPQPTYQPEATQDTSKSLEQLLSED